MIIPQYLRRGDRVAIVSPSGAVDPELIDGACETLRMWGLQPVLGQTAKGRHGRFSGTDEERLADLQWAMDSPEFAAILCGRGGYGAVRIVDKLRFDGIRQYPKWLIGFSDITAFHARFFDEGIASAHAVMAKAIAHADDNVEAVESLRKLLFGERVHYVSYSNEKSVYNRSGYATGELVGGNLSLLYALQGTPYALQPQGKVLFIEDLSERLYHIDRMMQNLRLSGVFEEINGLVVGQFTNIDADPSFGQNIEEIILSAVGDREIPVAFNFPVGHVSDNWALPHGVTAHLEVQGDFFTLDA